MMVTRPLYFQVKVQYMEMWVVCPCVGMGMPSEMLLRQHLHGGLCAWLVGGICPVYPTALKFFQYE